MTEDRRGSEEYASERDAELRSWITSVVYPYSPVLRRALDRAGLGRRGVRSTVDLARLPTSSIEELADGRSHVLEPTAEAIAAHGPTAARVRLKVADLFGRRPELAREQVDPEHRPVLWTFAGDPARPLFVASTNVDLERLAEIGRRSLAVSGVRRDDRLLVLDPAGGRTGPWQLISGARRAGVAVLHADDAGPDLVERTEPTVVAGRPSTLRGAADAGLPASVRLLIVHDGPRPDDAERAAIASTGLPVAEWWVAPAARAAWVRCPGGDGYHTWPTHELAEVLDPAGSATARGELVGSAVGWRGSVWLRVRTGVAAELDPQTCRVCRRTTPRVRLLPGGADRPRPHRRRRRREPVRA